ncbi:coiled-coil domain-containing protein [Aeoliella mucimassa]|uniref:hypothetical protein n=1 Tax=Aeoliella mucimassa TaxID=2527972 RepID=UPI0018D2F92C|nr:hypothetical protein [Aeoliella mucimassa]
MVQADNSPAQSSPSNSAWSQNVATALERLEGERIALADSDNARDLSIVEGVRRNLNATLELYSADGETLPSPPHGEVAHPLNSEVIKPNETSVVVLVKAEDEEPSRDALQRERRAARSEEAAREGAREQSEQRMQRALLELREQAEAQRKASDTFRETDRDRSPERRELGARREIEARMAREREQQRDHDILPQPERRDSPAVAAPHPRIVRALSEQQQQLMKLTERLEQLEQKVARLEKNSDRKPSGQSVLQPWGSSDSRANSPEQMKAMTDALRQRAEQREQALQQTRMQAELVKVQEQIERLVLEQHEMQQGLADAERRKAEVIKDIEQQLNSRRQALEELEQHDRELRAHRDELRKELEKRFRERMEQNNGRTRESNDRLRNEPSPRREVRRPAVPADAI